MISSQDGTEERRAFAFFLAPGRERVDWSSVGAGSAGVGTSGVDAVGSLSDDTGSAAAAGSAVVAGSAAATGSAAAIGSGAGVVAVRFGSTLGAGAAALAGSGCAGTGSGSRNSVCVAAISLGAEVCSVAAGA